MTIWQDANRAFRDSYDHFATSRFPVWKEFGDYAPPILDQPARWVGYAGGRIAADVVSDATREKIWRLNALQAQTTTGGRALGRNLGFNKRGAILLGFGLTNAVELASGNVDPRNLGEAGRPQGYKSLFPVENEGIDPKTGEVVIVEDFTKSQNPIAEVGARYLLGRTGGILPWEEFHLERPDVTPEEYARFVQAHNKRTLFGLEDASRAKTTLGGAALGGLVSAVTRKPAGVILGTGLGLTAPNTANISSELGVVRGTRESIDDPIGDLTVFGYRLPIAKVAGAALAVTGASVAGRKLYKAGFIPPLNETPLEKTYRKTPAKGRLWGTSAE